MTGWSSLKDRLDGIVISTKDVDGAGMIVTARANLLRWVAHYYELNTMDYFSSALILANR